MRNHAALGTRNQECYEFGDTADFKNVLNLRYALIPYLYSEYMKAVLGGTMYFKPLAFDFPEDRMAVETEDELLLGNEILIAPVYKQNATGRFVYLPEDMTQITWKGCKASQKSLTKGIHWIEMPLDTVVFFVRNNKMVPLYKCFNHTKDVEKNLEKDIYNFTALGNGTSYFIYNDNGVTTHYSLEKNLVELNG